MATSFLFFISVFLAGILSFFSPCILPLMPVYVGILLDSRDCHSTGNPPDGNHQYPAAAKAKEHPT